VVASVKFDAEIAAAKCPGCQQCRAGACEGVSTRSPGAENVSMRGRRQGRGFWVGRTLLPLYVQSMTSPMVYSGSFGRPLASK